MLLLETIWKNKTLDTIQYKTLTQSIYLAGLRVKVPLSGKLRNSEKSTFILRTDEMEKLIKLLNEYEKKNGRKFEVKEIGMKYRNNDLMIISKRYGFIKWLVDNDKIDRHNVKETNYGWEFNYYWTIPSSKRNKEIQVERLLMVLTIQDNPIEFLISILK